MREFIIAASVLSKLYYCSQGLIDSLVCILRIQYLVLLPAVPDT